MNILDNASVSETHFQAIELTVTQLKLNQARYEGKSVCPAAVQTLVIKFDQPQALIKPSAIAHTSLPENLDLTQPIVFFGQVPTWLYGRLISQCLEFSPNIPWMGCYDARGQQVVVVASQVANVSIGDNFPVTINRQPCPTILVGGPPDSGKSIFSNALRVALKQRYPKKTIYLHRASWDGEGNWTYEERGGEEERGRGGGKSELIKRLVTSNEFRIHENPKTAKLIPDYFRYHARTVENLRAITDCLIVDVGGLPQIEKQPLVQQCTHYIVISKSAEAVEDWHGLCGKWVRPLVVVHSVLETQQIITKTQPLEMVAGPWVSADTATMPEDILKTIDKLFDDEVN